VGEGVDKNMPYQTPITVGIIYGGPSTEHDVSLWSAKNISNACKEAGFLVNNIYVDRDGVWHGAGSGDTVEVLDTVLELTPGMGIFLHDGRFDIDIAFPIIHGTYGEDGTLQAVLESLHIPYVGCDVAASAVCMNKVLTKHLATSLGIPIAKFMTATKIRLPTPKETMKELGLPLFVKPASLGSSVGVSKVRNLNELVPAIECVLEVDDQVLIEEMIEGREIECSFLYDGAVRVSRCGEVSTTHEFYSYDAKYLDEASVTIEVPARISVEAEHTIQSYVRHLVDVIGISGFARIDFFLTQDGRVILNEINTIPGFTKFSMYPRLWAEQGCSAVQLVRTLVVNAVNM